MRDRLAALLRLLWRRKLIVVAVCVLGIAGMAVMIHQTSRPLFCKSCHEMQYVYRTWTESSHQDVSCEHCHYEAGVVGMIKTKIGGLKEGLKHVADRPAIEDIHPGISRVPSERCMHCHEQAELPDEFTYHLLTITHQKHLDRGAECTDCHANVVHGGKAPFKNTPSMSKCLGCHDGEEAPNRCGLCHLKLGEIRPPLYNPDWISQHKQNIIVTGEDTCVRCHGEDFCRTCHSVGRPESHRSDWIHAHASMEPSDRESCKQCHKPRGDGPEADSCVECHEAERAHGPGYINQHAEQFQKDADACGRCHKESFCQDCHEIYMPHEPGWLAIHGPASREKRDSCRTCHTDEFCAQCHTEGRPASHTIDFRSAHPALAKVEPETCRVCHPTNFCQRCHSNSPPASHASGPWIRAHGGSALAEPESCRACHSGSYCADCHNGVRMPHPEDWVRTHPNLGRNESSCLVCHARDFCTACHRGSTPDSHTDAWPKIHGKQARGDRDACRRCHSDEYCNTCHRLPMPHPADIGTSHAPLALGKDGRYCGLCHQSEQCADCHAHNPPSSHADREWLGEHGVSQQADSRCVLCHKANACRECHGLDMPHPDDWLMDMHGGQAERDPESCARCHDADLCQTCHESTPPSSHEAKSFAEKHGGKPDREPLCSLCHGRDEKADRNACDACHGGQPMPHPEGFTLEHKDIGDFDADGVCRRCHELDYCKVCHADIPDAVQ